MSPRTDEDSSLMVNANISVNKKLCSPTLQATALVDDIFSLSSVSDSNQDGPSTATTDCGRNDANTPISTTMYTPMLSMTQKNLCIQVPKRLEAVGITRSNSDHLDSSQQHSSKKIITFSVQIEKCEYEIATAATCITGTTNLCLKITPEKWDNDQNVYDIKTIRVRKARCFHVNSLLPNRTVDLDVFTTREYGSNEMKIMLNVLTFQTQTGSAPNIIIELALG